MLSQNQFNELLAAEKYCVDSSPIEFPSHGTAETIELKTVDDRESFLIDINRKGKIKLSKCTYQERYASVEVLLRLDIDGPPHENPDGELVPCPHLHIYKEGYGVKWAYEIPNAFRNTKDLVVTLRDFLAYCKVKAIPEIQRSVL